jgi:YVTN family beta-propeller protein
MRRSLPLLRPLLAFAVPLGVLGVVALGAPPSLARTGAPATATPAPAGGPWVWISNEGSGDLTLLDATLGEVVARVPVGKRPRGLRLSADGRLLYAAVSGSPRARPGLSPAFAGAAERGADGIAVVDTASRRLVAILPSGQDPESFDLAAGGRLLVVSNEETASAAVVDVASARLVGSVRVGEEPEGVTAAPDGRLVAVTSERENRVDFVDPVALTVAGTAPTCARPRSLVFTRDGAVAFAACEEGAAVAVVDARDLRPAGEIALPPGSRPMGLALSRDGARLYVSNGRAGTVSAIDVVSRKVVATSAELGQRLWGIAAADERTLWVADGPRNEVVALDARSLAVVRRVRMGELPWGVAVAP